MLDLTKIENFYVSKYAIIKEKDKPSTAHKYV